MIQATRLATIAAASTCRSLVESTGAGNGTACRKRGVTMGGRLPDSVGQVERGPTSRVRSLQ